mgnify:CR=1 FL=1
MPDAGQPLRGQLNADNLLDYCKAALAHCAELQLACLSETETLLKLGLADYRLKQLPQHYENFITQEKLFTEAGLNKHALKQFKSAQPLFHQRCKKLAAFGIPETLEHGDFHDNNVLIKGSKICLHDFGDASVSHPFFSLASFMASLEKHHKLPVTSAQTQILKKTYLRAWKTYGRDKDLIAAAELAYQLRPFIWLLSFQRVQACREFSLYPQFNNYLLKGCQTLLNNLFQKTS